MQRAPIRCDEWPDRLYSRPVARGLVALVARTPLTPNHLTAIASSHGVAAGMFLALGHGGLCAAALAGFLAWDCADGQLARRRGSSGYLGRAVDGFGDYVTGLAVHVGLGVALAATMDALLAAGLALACALAMVWASALLDRYKHRYLGSEDDLEAIARERAATPGFRGFLLGRLLAYARHLARTGRVQDRDRHRERVRGPMHLWLLNGPSTHHVALAVFAALGMPRGYVLYALGPALLLTVLTRLWQARRESA